MKKLFKQILLCFLIIPCMFLLAACGGKSDDVIINTKGNYVATNKEQTENFINEIKTNGAFEFNSFKVTMKSTTTVDGKKANVKINATFVGGDSDQFKMSLQINDETVNVYLKNGNYYLDTEGEKYKFDIAGDTSLVDAFVEMMPSFEMVEQSLLEVSQATNAVFERADDVEGGIVKLHIKGDVEDSDLGIVADTNAWFIFENNILTGVKVTENTTIGANVNNSEVCMQLFNGTEIQIPNESSFKTLSVGL